MSESRPLKDPHFLDLGNLPDVAQWIVLAACSGVIGNVVYDLLKSFKNRFGRKKVVELEKEVWVIFRTTLEDKGSGLDEGEDVGRVSDLSNEEIRARLREIFKDFG